MQERGITYNAKTKQFYIAGDGESDERYNFFFPVIHGDADMMILENLSPDDSFHKVALMVLGVCYMERGDAKG